MILTDQLLSELNRLGINRLSEAFDLRVSWHWKNFNHDTWWREFDRLGPVYVWLLIRGLDGAN